MDDRAARMATMPQPFVVLVAGFLAAVLWAVLPVFAGSRLATRWDLARWCFAPLLDDCVTLVVTVVVALALGALVVIVSVFVDDGAANAGPAINPIAAIDAINLFIRFLLSPAANAG
ncbi:MAG TPA: hypothetical protein VFY95_09345 [Sphingomicrobium sp.]